MIKNIGWTLGNDCPCKCKHCYSFSVRQKGKNLTKEIVDKVIEQIEKLNVETVNLGGNEPIFTNGLDVKKSMLPYILKELNKRNIKVGITTAGISLIALKNTYPECLELLNDVDISLDSPFENEHNENRGGDVYKYAIQALEICKEYNIESGIIMCAMNWNFTKDRIDALLEIAKKYEMFYWITLEDIEAEFGKRNGEESSEIQDYETFMEEEKEYAELMHKGKLKIHEEPEFDETQYYTANTGNAVELDTYLTNPHNRSVGLARIILYNGIQKHIEQFFKNPQNKEIFLCSTLHRDNLSSKYVSEFFGLKDSLYVNRRQGRDREVHICRIPREKAMEYLTDMYDKIAVLYGYNPNNKNIPASRQLQILQEQLEYEEKEKKRLVKAKTIDGKLKGINHKFIPEKERKVLRLKQRIQKVENSQQGLQQ